MSTFDKESGLLICDTLTVLVILYYNISAQAAPIGNATQESPRLPRERACHTSTPSTATFITTLAVLSGNGCWQHIPLRSSSMKTKPDRIAPSCHSLFYGLTSPQQCHSPSTLLFDPYGDGLRQAAGGIRPIYGPAWCVFFHS